MATPYISSKDADLLAWSANFNTLVTATPTAYGLTAPQATAYDALHDLYAAAYSTAVNPSTRTKPAVAAKDTAKFNLIANARLLAMIVQSFPTITPEQLADLGLTVRDTTPTPIPTPTTTPLLSVVAATNLSHVVRYADELTPASRKKPFGAIALQLWSFVGETPPVGPDACSFVANHKKNPVYVEYGEAESGLLATYYARWVTRTGLAGPWSLAMSMTVAAGGVPA